MTYNDLAAKIALLGSAEIAVASPALLTSVNLALKELYSSRSITRRVRLAVEGLKPVVYYRQINCPNGGPFHIDIPGYAYSFRIHGNCQLMTIKPGETTLTSINTGHEAKTIKGVTLSQTALRFFGTYTFTIYDFTVYKELFSQDPADVPEPGGTMLYDLRALYGDYMAFCSPPTDSAGERLTNCVIRDGVVEIDSSYNGEVVVTYRRLPTLATGEATEELDVPEEYAQLFPLLVAAYMLRDGDDALAGYYRSLYEENLKQLDKGSYRVIDNAYENVNGWA